MSARPKKKPAQAAGDHYFLLDASSYILQEQLGLPWLDFLDPQNPLVQNAKIMITHAVFDELTAGLSVRPWEVREKETPFVYNTNWADMACYAKLRQAILDGRLVVVQTDNYAELRQDYPAQRERKWKGMKPDAGEKSMTHLVLEQLPKKKPLYDVTCRDPEIAATSETLLPDESLCPLSVGTIMVIMDDIPEIKEYSSQGRHVAPPLTTDMLIRAMSDTGLITSTQQEDARARYAALHRPYDPTRMAGWIAERRSTNDWWHHVLEEAEQSLRTMMQKTG